MLYKKRCSWKFRKVVHMKTPVPELQAKVKVTVRVKVRVTVKVTG